VGSGQYAVGGVLQTNCPLPTANCQLPTNEEPMSYLGAVNKRTNQERRKQERRRSVRYTAETLVVIGGITWIDNEGTDRRRKVRRRQDREEIARRILADDFFPET